MNLKKNVIRNPFIHGIILGYLVTSVFEFSAPPPSFWMFLCSSMALWCTFAYVKWKLDNDTNDGDF